MNLAKTSPHDIKYEPTKFTFVHSHLEAGSADEPLTAKNGQQFYKHNGIWRFRNPFTPYADTTYTDWIKVEGLYGSVYDARFSMKIEAWFQDQFPEIYHKEQTDKLKALEDFLLE